MDKKELKSKIDSIDSLVTKLKQSKSLQVVNNNIKGRKDLANFSVNRKINKIEDKMKELVEELVYEIATFGRIDSNLHNSYCYAIGHIYSRARKLNIELEPFYTPLIPKDSRYYTGKISGRLKLD